MVSVTSAVKKSSGVVYFQTTETCGPELMPKVPVALCWTPADAGLAGVTALIDAVLNMPPVGVNDVTEWDGP
jgi:hypothetical protein